MPRAVAMYDPAMTDEERPGLSRAEPPPIPNDSPAIADLVIADMEDRKAAGIAKYGVALQAGNGRDPLIDAYQEGLDLVVYMRQLIAERWVRREEYDRLAVEAAELRERLAAHEQAASRLRLPVGVSRDARLADQGGVLCSSPGGGDCPSEGWHYIFGGPYTAYTMPEPDAAGALSWFVYDEDEASWREVENLGIVLVRDEDLGILADGARAWAAHSESDRDDIAGVLDSCGLGGTDAADLAPVHHSLLVPGATMVVRTYDRDKPVDERHEISTVDKDPPTYILSDRSVVWEIVDGMDGRWLVYIINDRYRPDPQLTTVDYVSPSGSSSRFDLVEVEPAPVSE
jgi:hypothetical protein